MVRGGWRVKQWSGHAWPFRPQLLLFSCQVMSSSFLQTPWTAACQVSLSITISQSLPKFISIESVTPSNHLILCCLLLLLPSIFPNIRACPPSQLFASGGPSIGAPASASVLPMNIQGWFPFGLTGLISLQSKGLSRVFPNTTVWKHRSFGALLSLLSNSHIDTWLLGHNKELNLTPKYLEDT